MGFFDKLFKKNDTLTFGKVQEKIMVLENQNGTITDPTKQDVKDYLQGMFQDPDQFITLTHAKAKYGVRYVQACIVDPKLIVQLGVEKENSTKLVEKICSNSKECVDIFYLFYETGRVNNLEEYQPVKFQTSTIERRIL